MKNITFSVDDQVYQKAKIKAAKLGTSVSALITAFLIQLADEETDFERRKRLQHETLASIYAFSAEERLDRSHAHERLALA